MSLLVAAGLDGQKLHQNKSTSMQFSYTKNFCIWQENSLKRLNIYKVKLTGYTIKKKQYPILSSPVKHQTRGCSARQSGSKDIP